MDKKKHAGGRPITVTTSNLPEDWKEKILEYSAQGMSDVEIRANLCMLGGTFNHGAWDTLIEREAEFSATVKKGKVLCQAWWERTCREALKHGKEYVFETGAWTMNMKNRFGWTDKTEIDHGIKDEDWERYEKLSITEINARLSALTGAKPTRTV